MQDYRRNHYVPQWYQYRFFPTSSGERKFFYLDLKPEVIKISKGRSYKRNALLRWGPPKCFQIRDLYTTKFGNWESTEIEQKFFGKIDGSGHEAVEYFTNFQHPSVNPDALHNILPYMTVQKLRTPKGLKYLAEFSRLSDKNQVLFKLQELQQIFCALWTECVWCICDASQSDTKFILSDHPVTVYNKGCFPLSNWCRDEHDPEIWFHGTHTIFPLCLEKVLILTNLSHVRNPYSDPVKHRPNSTLFRPSIFNFMQIQTGRELTDLEVTEINYIIKSRASKFIAAAKEEWLYPERTLRTQNWDKLGSGYLLMPDPRSVSFSSEIIIGYDNGRSDGFDAYGRKPWQPGYDDKALHDSEWLSFHAFKGEFARVFGPKRRGLCYEFGTIEKTEDSPDFHAYHLSLEHKYPKKRYKN